MTPLRIAFVGEYRTEGAGIAGANAHAMLIAALRARGHTVEEVYCDLEGGRRATVASRLFSPNRARWRGRFHLHPIAYRERSRLAREGLTRLDPPALDAIVQYGSAFDASCSGVPHLMWTDTTSAVTAGEPFSWIGAMPESEQQEVIAQERALLRKCDIVMPWSRYAGEKMVAMAGAPSERIRVTYVGPSMTIPDRSHERSVRAGDRMSTLRALFVGREFQRKGGDVFLDAVRLVRARGIDARAIVVGPTTIERTADFVDFVGFLDKNSRADCDRLLSLYAEADLFCLPTRREPFGIAVAEAMLAGLPVIATGVSAIPEMISHGETGFLVAPDDPVAIADHMEALARGNTLRQRIGRAAALHARERFEWASVAQKVEAAVMEARATRNARAAGIA